MTIACVSLDHIAKIADANFACFCLPVHLLLFDNVAQTFFMLLSSTIDIDIHVICLRLIPGYVHMQSISVMKLHLTVLHDLHVA